MFINKDKYIVNKHSNSKVTISGGHVFEGGHPQHWAAIGFGQIQIHKAMVSWP